MQSGRKNESNSLHKSYRYWSNHVGADMICPLSSFSSIYVQVFKFVECSYKSCRHDMICHMWVLPFLQNLGVVHLLLKSGPHTEKFLGADMIDICRISSNFLYFFSSFLSSLELLDSFLLHCKAQTHQEVAWFKCWVDQSFLFGLQHMHSNFLGNSLINEIKYFAPPMEAVANGPHTCVWT